jgi:hypothetical protein
MRSIHGDDFCATVAMGREGDLGCDGHLVSKKAGFAVYGPEPYFRLDAARDKMRRDFARFIECWTVPDEMQSWYFVVNYPGAHPSLLKTANELKGDIDDLEIFVWSRYDLTQRFLAEGQRNLIKVEFGDVSVGNKILAPLTFVPEDTALPAEEAQRAYRRLWARLTCNKKEFEKLDRSFMQNLQARPYEHLIVYGQFILGAIASAVMNNVFDPVTLKAGTLRREAGLPPRAHKREFDRAWSFPIKLLMEEDYDWTMPEWPEDTDKLVIEMVITCSIQELLILALIRMQARMSGAWETDILGEVWSWATERFKIHPE